MAQRILTDKHLGPAKAEAILNDCTGMMAATMRRLMKDHGISVPSGHLMMISKLVSHLQFYNAADAAYFLQAMIAIAQAGDAAALAAAHADYDKAHAALLRTLELSYAELDDDVGGRA